MRIPAPVRPRLLLTGFEPFAQYAINPSWIAAQQVAQEFPRDVIARCLPVRHEPAREQICQVLDQVRPQIIEKIVGAIGEGLKSRPA